MEPLCFIMALFISQQLSVPPVYVVCIYPALASIAVHYCFFSSTTLDMYCQIISDSGIYYRKYVGFSLPSRLVIGGRWVWTNENKYSEYIPLAGHELGPALNSNLPDYAALVSNVFHFYFLILCSPFSAYSIQSNPYSCLLCVTIYHEVLKRNSVCPQTKSVMSLSGRNSQLIVQIVLHTTISSSIDMVAMHTHTNGVMYTHAATALLLLPNYPKVQP